MTTDGKITADDIFEFSVQTMDLETSESRAEGRKAMIDFLSSHEAADENVQGLKDAILDLYSPENL